MSLQDPIADMLTRIRNGQMVKKIVVKMAFSKTKAAIAKVLEQEGYITKYDITQDSPKQVLEVYLKYYESEPVIESLKRESRPGLRLYKSCKDLPSIKGGLGISIISTCKGIMPDRKARALGLGGEVLCSVS